VNKKNLKEIWLMPTKFDFLSPGIQINEIDESILPSDTNNEGPIIIGRARKGPGMQPIKIKTLANFVSVFGKPAPGGVSEMGDVWRDGPNLSAPTYGAYAAQAWLASENSPITYVRLLGDQSSVAQAGTKGLAGWQLSSSIATKAVGSNSTAYGLFIADNSAISTLNYVTFTIGGTIDEGGYYTITDSAGTAVKFEADAGAGTTETSALRTFDQSGGVASAASALVTAINAAVTAGYLKHINAKAVGGGVLKIASLKGAGSFTDANEGTDAINPDGTTALTAPTNDAITNSRRGALAAIIYCDSGYLQLHNAGKTDNSDACAMLPSVGDSLKFGVNVFKSDGTQVGSTNFFNFNRQSSQYIRNVLNTNPQLVNSDMIDSTSIKTYWLGETFEQHLTSLVTGSSSGNQHGILLPLQKLDNNAAATGNWGYHRAAHSASVSGWIIADDTGAPTSYDASQATKLFRFESLHSGDELQKDIMIGIEDIRFSANPLVNSYGSFTVRVMDVAGNTLEKYNNLNLKPGDQNHIAVKIGDQRLEWDDDNKRFKQLGNNVNRSDYVRVRMYKEVPNYQPTNLPFGFMGPGRPKTFTLISGSTTVHGRDGGGFAGAFVAGSGSVPLLSSSYANNMSGQFYSGSIANAAVQFEFPKLRMRVSGSDGLVSNQYKPFFGVRPKVSATSNLHDTDYCDYLRALPSNYNSNISDPSGDFEHSFIFSLDDIKIDTTLNKVQWVSGSRRANKSYTAVNGSSALLDKKVRQFAMPLFGGRHGLDVTESEPFRNAKITGFGTDDTSNYLRYTVNKALDSVSDPEAVPGNLLTVPGIYITDLTDKVMAVAQDRQDVLAIIDIQSDYKSIYESTDSAGDRRGSVDLAISNLKSRNIDNSFACCFYPAVQIIDKLNNNQRVWIPSSIAGLGAMAQSEAATAAWFAPAGFNRGGLGNLGGPSGPTVVQARQRLDSDQRDLLYSQVNVNPIATFPNEGVVVFGQKTLQTSFRSALDRINVRRLLIYLKSRISRVARNILFDNNVEATWNRFLAGAEPILEDVQSRFGLTEYKLVLDETTTTPELIDQNILYAQVYLKPARAIEYIAIDFIVTRTGAEFA